MLPVQHLATMAAPATAQHNSLANLSRREAVHSLFASVIVRHALRHVRLLDGLPEHALELISGLFTLEVSGKGERIFVQGSTADKFYVLIDGTVKLICNGADIATIRAQVTTSRGRAEQQPFPIQVPARNHPV